MTWDIYAHTLKFKTHRKDVFLWTLQKYRNFNQFSGVEILRKRKVTADTWTICPKICRNCPPKENLHTKKLEKIPVLYVVEATFAINYLCLLFNAGLFFFDKICLIWLSSDFAVFLNGKKWQNFEIFTTK